MRFSIKIREIVSLYQNAIGGEKDKKGTVLRELVSKFNLSNTEDYDNVEQYMNYKLCTSFYNNYKKRWSALSKNNKNKQHFEHNNSAWMNSDFVFDYSQKNSEVDHYFRSNNDVGRCKLTYDSLSQESKRKRIRESTISREESFVIAKKKMKNENNINGCKLMDFISDADDANQIMAKLNEPVSRSFTAEEAVALMIEANLTKYAYKTMRSFALDVNRDIYPVYEKVAQAKQDAYPNGIIITENKCEVSIQNLLDHTIHRLINYLKINVEDNGDLQNLKLICKIGFDGSNVSVYKQKAQNDCVFSGGILCSSLVPLQLVNDRTKKVLWLNPRSSSTRLVRTFNILFQKETDELCKEEENYIKTQIQNLKSCKIGECTIRTDMYLTMIDGKVVSALNDKASQTCYLCGKTISNFNKIDFLINLEINENSLQYSFPVLHAYIRFMELVCHISYRLEIKKWRVPKNEKEIVKTTKNNIQNLLREKIGILVDFPTQGSGNTNDGNTARRFFNSIDVVAEVTGFDKDLLSRFKIILAVINAHKAINVETFKQFCLETARLYVSLYPWYYMPTSMHVILIHGFRIIQTLPLPIAFFSEEAQESNHKNVKKFLEKFARKHSRTATNEDMFKRLLLYSDPLLSMLRKLPKTKEQPFTKEMKSLLIFDDENGSSSNDESIQNDNNEDNCENEGDENEYLFLEETH